MRPERAASLRGGRWRLSCRRGYLLVEFALALLVLAVLGRAAVVAGSGSLERLRESRADTQLEAARHALIAHLVARGRLPCPIDAARVRMATRASSSGCDTRQGFLPGALLGLPGRAFGAGGVRDPWGRPLRYAIAAEWPSAIAPDAAASRALLVCRGSSDGACGTDARFATDLAAIVWSDGERVHETRAERENRDGDTRFVQGVATEVAGRAFDDRLVWLSTIERDYWLLRVGWWSVAPGAAAGEARENKR